MIDVLLSLFSLCFAVSAPPGSAVQGAAQWSLDSLDCGAKAYLANLPGGKDALGPLLVQYSARGYTSDGICLLLDSLRGIVEHGLTPSRPEQKSAISTLTSLSPDGRLTLVLDPTCSKCSEVLRQIDALGPQRYGELNFVLAPSESRDSVELSSGLLAVEDVAPLRFSEALREVALVAPQSSEIATIILDKYLTVERSRNPNGQRLQSSKDTARHLASLGVSPPALIFRGRLIVRTGGEIPFDPFRDVVHLTVVLELIKASEMAALERSVR